VIGSTVPSLPRLAHLLAQINLDSSVKKSELNAHTLAKGGEYPIYIGRLMANLQQIQFVLWILLMIFQNPTGCRETAFDMAEEAEIRHWMIKQE
jgi:hypothetical protein